METRIETYKKNHKTKQIVMILGLLGGICICSQLTFAEGQWIADQKGCKVWNANPASNESITWSGTCPSGYANGYGILQWYKSGMAGGRYEGEYLEGNVTGKGIYQYLSGNRYEGNWVNNHPEGKGKYIWSDGGSYDGDWVDGKRTGKGEYKWLNGDRYMGAWVDNERHGKGMFIDDSSRYEGDWVHDKKEGRGVLSYVNGDRYEGDFLNDSISTGTKFTASGNTIRFVNGVDQSTYTPFSSTPTYMASSPTPSAKTSSVGASFLTGLLKTAVGVAVAHSTGNNALGAQVALASPEELSGLTNQVALESRQHSEAEARKKQAIKDQQMQQLQEQQAAMERAQRQSSYGMVSSNGNYGTIGSGSGSNNSYGNTPTTISSGQNNSSSNSNSQPKTERINVPSQSGCINFAWDKQDGNIQWFKFRNGCAYPVNVYWRTKIKGEYKMTLGSGQSDSGWLSRDRDRIENYKACSLKNGKYDISFDHSTNQCWSFADFR
ncbi:hypothetical protein [Acinetobacter sp. Ac_5812]|uniref:MORN repeat-containing protein n=1 Tax=Acinetobacter sp. Ac_5812 TaxID=1848937 RepID=UPI001490548D|nr:hypothetical protein [Acinetobacter sp. Ac_5812]NNP67727.1 hypothetical protein [Acinetobacter sp. Ac_5812]